MTSSSRKWQLNLHYAVLLAARQTKQDPLHLILRNEGSGQGAMAYAKRFWHEVFEEFSELRAPFAEYAEQFGPYLDTQETQPSPAGRLLTKDDVDEALVNLRKEREQLNRHIEESERRAQGAAA